jgi:hypothetical protein
MQENMVKDAWEQAFEHNDHLLFGSQKVLVDISTLQPDTVHIFRLCQIYLDNFNPLLKFMHTPSLQGRIIECASNITNIDPNLEALMFSIYCMSIVSLTAEECHAIFKSQKQDLLIKFQFACEQALIECKFLRTSNLDCLTALYLYLVSSQNSSFTSANSYSYLQGLALILDRCLLCLALLSELPNEWILKVKQPIANMALLMLRCVEDFGGH